MQIQRYTFHCTFTSPARLPGYLGSTLRGALGWALIKTSCTLKQHTCHECPLRQQCAHGWLFATEPYKNGEDRIINARPHPLVIQPQLDGISEKGEGDKLLFSILLFGRGNEYLPHLVHAIRQMGKAGIGQGRGRGMGRFSLRRVTAGKETCFTSTNAILQRPGRIRECTLAPARAGQAKAVRLTLRTPLRLKRHNKLQIDLSFAEVIRACLRRISALEAIYGQGEPDLDYAGLVRKAGDVRIRDNNLHWQELFRWSNRQRRKISLAGLAGSCVYEGDVSPFLPLLAYCREVHIGKQTIFGLGWIDIARE